MSDFSFENLKERSLARRSRQWNYTGYPLILAIIYIIGYFVLSRDVAVTIQASTDIASLKNAVGDVRQFALLASISLIVFLFLGFESIVNTNVNNNALIDELDRLNEEINQLKLQAAEKK